MPGAGKLKVHVQDIIASIVAQDERAAYRQCERIIRA